MPSVSDILSILDKIPLWQKLKQLPDRYDSLERRISELEAAIKFSPGNCPACNSTLFKAAPVPRGKQSPNHRRYACDDCGYDELRSTK